jgi:hypothetical protein
VLRVETGLEEVHKRVRLAASKHSGAVEKLEVADKTWIAYRDAYIDAMYPADDKQAVYGSMFPIEVALLRAELALRQIAALKELLKHYSAPAP